MEPKVLLPVLPVTVKDEGLTVVWNPGDSAEFDLIFVHDFGDGVRRTWATQNFFWPEEVLPKEVSNARVIMYGYPTKRSLSALPQQGTDLLLAIMEERKKSKIKGRPVVFICHGLGGLICKNAIIASGTSKNAQRFLANSTRGIVFLGTPHRGSKASLQAKISRIVRHFSAEQRGSISLPNGRSGLWDQLNTFPHMMDKFHIEVECFYEASASQVVEEAAATMGRGERTHALNATHVEMCRFEKSTDPGLLCIVSCIKRFCTLPQDVTKPDEKYTIPAKSPFSRNVNFCGREEMLEVIRKRLWPNSLTDDSSGPLNRNSISLVGSPGAGKSQILLEYMYRYHTHQQKYSSVFWLNAGSASQLQASSYDAVISIIGHYDKIWKTAPDRDQRIAHSLKIFEPPIMTRAALVEATNRLSSVQLLRNWLSHESNNRWLLMVDNYDPDSFELEIVIPVSETGHILLSTNKPYACPGSLLVTVTDSIGEAQSVDLLITSSGKDPGTVSRNDMSWASNIVKLIGQLPLALEQVGAYIAVTKTSLQKYHKLLKTELDYSSDETGDKHKLNTIWGITWSKLDVKAKHLLELCSLIAHEDIPIKLLKGGKEDVSWMKDDQTILEAVGSLLAFSFITSKPDDTSFSIQPLFHLWVRRRLERDPYAMVEAKKLVTCMVSASFNFEEGLSSSAEYTYEHLILPHIELTTEIFEIQCNGYGEFLDQRTRKVAYSLARAYERLANPRKAAALYQRALKWKEKNTCVTQDFKIMDAYAQNLQSQGELDEALTWYKQALEGMERALGADNVLTISIVQHIAILHTSRGQFDMAVVEYQRVLAAQEKKRAKGHPITLETQQRLALVYLSQGNYAATLELLQKVQGEREKNMTIGPNHSSTLETLGHVASVLEKQGRHSESLDAHQLLLDRKMASLGEHHHSTLETLDGMAELYTRLGRYIEALSCHEKVLDGLMKLFGTTEHPWTFGTVSKMGDIYLRLGQYVDAEKEYRKAYAGFRALGVDVREFETATSLGKVLCLRGQYAEALDWSRLAEGGLEEKQGKDGISTLVAKSCTANILQSQGNYSQALALYQQVLSGYTTQSGAQHPLTLATTSSIADVLTKQGHFSKALQHINTLEPLQEKLLGDTHPDVLSTLTTHGLLSGETGNYERSLTFHQRVFNTLTSSLGKSHPQTLVASYHLAVAHENKAAMPAASAGYNTVISGLPADHPYVLLATVGMGNIHRISERYEQAHSLYTTALARLKEKLGDSHPETIKCACYLAATAVKLKRLPEAEALAAEAVKAAEDTLGSEHPISLMGVHTLAKVHAKRKRYKEAAAGFQKARKAREKSLGKGHKETLLSVREEKKMKRRSWGWIF